MILFFTVLAVLNFSIFESTPVEESSAPVSSIVEAVQKADSDTLIVFDVDEVLITTKDIFLHPELEDTFLSCVQKAMSEADPAQQESIEKKLSHALVTTERYLVDPSMPALIKELQDSGRKIIALTSHPTGKLGHLASVEKWKVESIKSFGFHFERSFPEIKNQTLSLKTDGVPSPLYEDGVLFSRGFSKGHVLLEFLTLIPKPKKVLFIDDLAKNIEAVRTSLQETGIEVTCLHYTKCALLADQINKELVRGQFQLLLESGKWVCDTEYLHKQSED